MLVVLSPAKKLDMSEVDTTATDPHFADDAKALAKTARGRTQKDLQKLMGISENLAKLNADRFKAISAFAPIVSPLNCPWGEKALTGYIGADKAAWRQYDACALIEDGARVPDLLVDQGDADGFLENQLKPELLVKTCEEAGQPLTLRMQEGYDHSYYFISSFMGDHLDWHAARLKG